MNFPLVRVPDFNEIALKEAKPKRFHEWSDQDQEEYIQGRVMQLQLAWSCKMAAASFNLALAVGLALILVAGPTLLAMARAYLGVK